jgi:hypothetical protein
VAVTVPSDLPSPSVSTETSTRSFRPSPTIVAVTVRAPVVPLSGSVARTRSPASTWSMRLREPSAMSTGVSGVKLFIGQLPPEPDPGRGVTGRVPIGSISVVGWLPV